MTVGENGGRHLGDGRPGADGWHGRVTVGVKDDGTPDRRHVSAKTRPEATAEVRKLEKLRDDGTVPKAGQKWTVAKWLTHWITEIVGAADAPGGSAGSVGGEVSV